MAAVYWTTKEGEKIDIDEMSVSHLRNVLKMIVKSKKKVKKFSPQKEADDLFNEDFINDIEAEYDAEDFGNR